MGMSTFSPLPGEEPVSTNNTWAAGTMWVVMALSEWESLEITLGRDTVPMPRPKGWPHCVGFLPIFTDYDEATRWRDTSAPTATIHQTAARL